MVGLRNKGDKRISFGFGVSVFASQLAIGICGMHASKGFRQAEGLGFALGFLLKLIERED